MRPRACVSPSFLSVRNVRIPRLFSLCEVCEFCLFLGCPIGPVGVFLGCAVGADRIPHQYPIRFSLSPPAGPPLLSLVSPLPAVRPVAPASASSLLAYPVEPGSAGRPLGVSPTRAVADKWWLSPHPIFPLPPPFFYRGCKTPFFRCPLCPLPLSLSTFLTTSAARWAVTWLTPSCSAALRDGVSTSGNRLPEVLSVLSPCLESRSWWMRFNSSYSRPICSFVFTRCSLSMPREVFRKAA